MSYPLWVFTCVMDTELYLSLALFFSTKRYALNKFLPLHLLNLLIQILTHYLSAHFVSLFLSSLECTNSNSYSSLITTSFIIYWIITLTNFSVLFIFIHPSFFFIVTSVCIFQESFRFFFLYFFYLMATWLFIKKTGPSLKTAHLVLYSFMKEA